MRFLSTRLPDEADVGVLSNPVAASQFQPPRTVWQELPLHFVDSHFSTRQHFNCYRLRLGWADLEN